MLNAKVYRAIAGFRFWGAQATSLQSSAASTVFKRVSAGSRNQHAGSTRSPETAAVLRVTALTHKFPKFSTARALNF